MTEVNSRIGYLLFTCFFIAVTVASIFFIIRYSNEISRLSSYGYLGGLVVGFIAGCSLPLPLSYLLIIFTLGGIPGLHPALVGLAGGVGAGLGGTLIYLIGRSGRGLFKGSWRYALDDRATGRLFPKFIGWAKKRGSVLVFVMSAMLNPVFAPMALTMGALRFRWFKFLLMCVAGNILKAVIISYAGYLGLGTLLRWLGF